MITILNGGLHSIIQDLGRTGYQQYGVIVSGAMDRYALRIANLLVGNEEEEAGIEITFGKTALLFHDERLIAVTGGNLRAELNEKEFKMNRPYLVKKGDILQFKTPLIGCRAYVAISGGFKFNTVLESKSTYEKAEFGGWEGRALKDADKIPLNDLTIQQEHLIKRFTAANWSVNCWSFYSFKQKIIPIHILRGLDYHLFHPDSIRTFEQLIYTISSRSNRMGYHLESTVPIHIAKQQEILSEAVTFGTIQIPPSGKPMILMADAQTIGGYPKISQVLATDFSRLAQAMPGQKIQFNFVDLQTAEKKWFDYEAMIRRIKYSIQLQYQKLI